MATINRNIEQVRKTANQMRADNVTLEDGQLGYESDTRRGKVGPGAYNSLPYKDDLNIAEADVDYAADQRDGGATGGVVTQEYVDNEILAVNQGWNDGDSLLFNDYTAKLATKADAVPTYIATLTQSGTDAPVATVIKNTLGGVVTFGYASPGAYMVTATGLLTTGKTAIFCGDGSMLVVGITMNGFGLNSIDLSIPGPDDNLLAGHTIKIEVYP